MPEVFSHFLQSLDELQNITVGVYYCTLTLVVLQSKY